MKKNIVMLFIVAAVAMCFGAQIMPQILSENIVVNGTPYCIGPSPSFNDTESVTTNLVIAYEIVERKWGACACPDGIEGCAVYHQKIYETTRLEKAKVYPSKVEEPGSFVRLYWDEQMTQKYDGRNIVPVYFHTKYSHPIGFISFDAVRRAEKYMESNDANSSNP